MDIHEIEELVEILHNSKVTELTVEAGDSKVTLRKQFGKEAPPVKAVASHPPSKEAQPETREEQSPESVYVTAPMVGIFHIADETAEVGATVRRGQVVCAIESMKLMNDVVSEHDGIIAEVLVEDGTPVEYGQELFRIELSALGTEEIDAEE